MYHALKKMNVCFPELVIICECRFCLFSAYFGKLVVMSEVESSIVSDIYSKKI